MILLSKKTNIANIYQAAKNVKLDKLIILQTYSPALFIQYFQMTCLNYADGGWDAKK